MTARRTVAMIAILVLVVGVVTAPVQAQPAGTLLVGLVAEPVNLVNASYMKRPPLMLSSVPVM